MMTGLRDEVRSCSVAQPFRPALAVSDDEVGGVTGLLSPCCDGRGVDDADVEAGELLLAGVDPLLPPLKLESKTL